MNTNPRLVQIKNMINMGQTPVIVDATYIGHQDPDQIPLHWGDIEALGWGHTTRKFDRMGNKTVTRHYTGPGTITLDPSGVSLKAGQSHGDDD